MGLLSGFFERRRRRESAVQPGSGMASVGPPSEDVKPVGQPFSDVGQPMSINMGAGAADLGSLLGMIGTAMQTGQFQVQQSENQVIDLQGSGLREEIIEAMRQSGVDPEAAPGGQVDAARYGDLQQQILNALQNHGIDVSQMGEGVPGRDTDGDGRPG